MGSRAAFSPYAQHVESLRCRGGCVCGCFPQRVDAVVACLPQPLCGVVPMNGHKKAPVRGLRAARARRPLKAHDTGNGAQIGIEIGVKWGVVVVDGAVGILEAVAGENAHHR